jgi:hypothetical protein
MADMGALFAPAMQTRDPLDQAQKAVNLANSAQQLDLSKFELALKQMNVLRGVTASFLADPEAGKVDLTKRIQDEASKMAAMGLYSPQQVVTFLKGFPKDPGEQYKMLVRTHAQTLSAAEQLQAILGPTQTTDTGPGLLTTQTPAYPNLPARERSYVGKGLPPTTTTTDPTSLETNYVGDAAPPRLEQRPAPPRMGPPQPEAAPSNRLGVSPPASAPALPPATEAAPARQKVPAALPVGSAKAAEVSAEDAAAERTAAGSYQERINPMRNAIAILEKMDPKDIGAIGPGSDTYNMLKSAAQTWGLGEIAGVDPNKVADFNKLRKYFEDAASRRASGLGPKTNDGLASALTASPNTKLDKLSALELSKVNLALDRMRQAAILEFDSQQPSMPEGKFGKWRSQWSTKQDPRAFIYDLMTPEAQRKLVSSLSKEQRDKFEASLELADKHGLLGDVGGK